MSQGEAIHFLSSVKVLNFYEFVSLLSATETSIFLLRIRLIHGWTYARFPIRLPVNELMLHMQSIE